MIKFLIKKILINLHGKLDVLIKSSFALDLKSINGLEIADDVKFNGKPLIDIRCGGQIHIARGVVINSLNNGYHLNMHSVVKLFVDKPGAIIEIGENTRIHGSCLHAVESIRIGRNCLIAANCQIFDCSGHDLSFDKIENRINTVGTSKPVVIEDNVWIGANCIILPGVTIGMGSVVAAGSVVTKNVPPMVLIAGSPARVIKRAAE